YPFEMQVLHLNAVARLLESSAAGRERFGDAPPLEHWQVVTHSRAATRGGGAPRSHWTARGAELTHYPGHFEDALYFAVPLRGDFEVTGELTSFGYREAQLAYGGLCVALKPDLKTYSLSQHTRPLRDGDFQPPLDKLGDWYAFRLAVKDGVYTAFANGRKI